MSELVRQLFYLLTPRQRLPVVILLGAMVLQAAVAVVGVASIVPFMSLVADTTLIQQDERLRWVYQTGGFSSESVFVTAAGLAVVVAITLSNGVSAVTTWLTRRFVAGANHRLSLRLLRGYLAQPYSFFVSRNSASLNKNILGEAATAVNGVLMPTLGAVTHGLLAVAMVTLLLLIDPILVVGAVAVLGGAYGLVYLIVRGRQNRLGQIRKDANHLRFKFAGEAFGGIKDVKILQREAAFLKQFQPASRKFHDAIATNAAIAQLPRYLLETLAFGGMVLLVLYHLRAGRELSAILPLVSLYALAGYRMMPALQSVFAHVVTIRFNRPALDELCADLVRFDVPEPEGTQSGSPLKFENSIHIDNLSFEYPAAATPALRNVSLQVRRNEVVGIVGASGSGKTTLVDLVLGLYEPTEGSILVDGTPLDRSTIPRWRRQVGYVPQSIFLTDDTVARNIAFGVLPADVDAARVEAAARMAQLHGFVSSLPNGYETLVGERGVRLSGGQRQRIGIARALYHDPDVLIMDEATSALDGVTEDAVMEAIRELAGRKTLIIIAHRLTTVRECNQIYLLDGGQLLDRGTFSELLERSLIFRGMARLPGGASADAVSPDPNYARTERAPEWLGASRAT
jgi:ATP-binding cassette, subfamily B, bacterial PglK